MTRRRGGLTVVLLQGNGRPAWSLRIPILPTSALSLSGLVGIALCVFIGWHAQAMYGLQGERAFHRMAGAPTARWSMFELAAPTRKHQTVSQLRRRAALMHALKLGLGTRRAATRLLGGIVTDEWREAAEKGPANDGTLLWPVREGWFVRGYGSGEGGYHLAVDVMGDRGTDVRAAAPGVVGYASDGVRGYGNMIMIIHPGGWVTLYAHNDRNHVVPGQRVKRGQLIADLGNTGISRGPHVHFELLHGGMNCDPLSLFRPGVRHRPGHLGAIPLVSWPTGERRPREVRCAPRRRHPRSRHGHPDEHAHTGGGEGGDALAGL